MPARGGTTTQRRWRSRRRIKPFHFQVPRGTLQPPKPPSQGVTSWVQAVWPPTAWIAAVSLAGGGLVPVKFNPVVNKQTNKTNKQASLEFSLEKIK